MHYVRERNGGIKAEDSMQDRMTAKLYHTVMGRMLLKILISPKISGFAGWFLDSGASRMLVGPFIKNHRIDMEDYEKKSYASYNDFFTRRLAPGAREICQESEAFVSPCDSRLSVYPIGDDSVFPIKHTRYTVRSLLRSRKLAERFAGGYAWVFRLCVEDYHRYIFVDGGRVSSSRRIRGVLHTVNPIANDRFPIYKENAREYSLLYSDHFGTLLQMEVGAMLVGRIENRPVSGKVHRGQEKGNFAFGGSTVILMTERGAVRPDRDILGNSAKGIETKVRLGEKIGAKFCTELTVNDNGTCGI